MASSLPLSPATARCHVLVAADTCGADLMLNELISYLPTATVADFMEDFNRHLDAGDFADLIGS